MKKTIRENLFFLLIATSAFFEAPAIVHAGSGGTTPIPFTEALNLSRGKISPGLEESYVIPKSLYCDFMIQDWGWDSCEGVDGFITSYREDIDTLVISAPNSDGYVEFADWYSEDKDDAIRKIREELDAGLKAQGEQLGVEMKFEKWVVYPQLNKDEQYLYYAFDTLWNGQTVTNIKASLFDRQGYVAFLIVPVSENPSGDQVKDIVSQIAHGYTPTQDQSYASFVSGDKVAAAGVVGVLASMMGVKYGKGIMATIMGFVVLLAKKFWFVIFLPILWFKKIFKNRTKPD